MNEALDFLARYGAVVLFVAVFIEQFGIPLPATPWLLAAGALAAGGKLSGLVAFSAAALGSIVADMIWFYLGRRSGHRVLKLLCKISLEPTTCTRRTQDIFARYGMRAVVAGKFIPGFSVLVSPLAGSVGVNAARFFIFDALGAVLYSGTFVLLGTIFSKQLEQIFSALSSLGHGAIALILGAAALYISYKFFQRRRLLRELRMAAISADELLALFDEGRDPVVLDLRSMDDIARQPGRIRGAIHVPVAEIGTALDGVAVDREIILYCSCPNEVSSARVAKLLYNKGFLRVRALLGGIDAWRARDLPTEIDIGQQPPTKSAPC
jgi:membrane protein DedA with SNARE-associated domain/rhodanese-related sulfurtransferase